MAYVSKARRDKSATVRMKQDGVEKEKFPIDSHETAESAVKLRHNAKPPLTKSQEARVLREAAKYGVHPATQSTKKSVKK